MTYAAWKGPLLATALALVTAGGLHAQTATALERIRAGLPPDQAQAVEAVIELARDRDLPVQPLVDKALEGIAKRAPAPLVVRALEQLADRLGQARTILADGTPPQPTDVAAVAAALNRGVSEEAIRMLRAGSMEGEPIGLAAHTLGDLLDRNVPVDQAVDVLEAWRDRGADEDELRELPAAVEGLIRRGFMPAQAAAAVATAVRAGMPPTSAVPGDITGKGKGPGPGGLTVQPPIPPGSGPPSSRPDPGTVITPPLTGPPPA